MEAPQIFQKICVEDVQRTKIINIIRSKMEIPDIFDDLIQTGCNGISSVTGIFSVKGIKNNDLISRVFKLSLHHS